MSGAQPKAGNIVGCISITAEVNYIAAKKRYDQGWVDKLVFDINELVKLVKDAQLNNKIISFAYIGNIVDVWETFLKENINVTIGSDQTSLHNPWSGGYYPADLSYDEANNLLKDDPLLFKKKVQESLKRQSKAIKMHVKKGTYFFDYGNAFLLEASRAGADVMNDKKTEFCYPSYVQDILGPICFDYGFGPFRWVCASGNPKDLEEIPFSLLIKDCNISFMNHKRTCVQLAVDIANKMVDNFGDEIKVDMDTMIAGAILIDVGKLLEYEIVDGKLTTSNYGKVVRHPFSGVAIAARFGLPPAVQHIIATHSKEGDLGKRTVESIIVHHADFVSFEPLKA